MTYRNAWGISAVALGAYEAAALTTDLVPTITDVVRRCCARWRALTWLAVAVWMVALARHLLTGPQA